ncbi:DeoR family transcriptional regulator [Mangrovactinospora gilvigrisea]|uniref:DeoR family transcriptional regulator n=1 Tax=Mangrovactinospora gilvigrisea TaxID=1428644 RepID=A0A1J7BAI3_9ACTN|nr:DeoR/GlpR family DNA-binding transcription regulator [Mangrovactinospora gilvigrisea]OIV35703.1 DeoR family transcriptional regulator [Mangrovactinospora gilvigrisea]
MTDGRPAKRGRQERQQLIVDHVVAQGEASAAELSALTGVSLMTVHRDIAELAERGILRRYHGGVSAHPSTVFESSSDFRLHANRADKEALGRAALQFVHPGMSVMLDDSTTALHLARLLPGVGPLTVVSNYRLVMEELRGAEGIRMIGVGGEYSRTHDSFVGLPAEEMIARFSVDLAVQSTSAMDADMTYHQEQELVAVKRAIRAVAAVNVLLMDASKVGRAALHRMAPVSGFDHVLLTGPVDAELVAGMREHTDVQVIAVDGPAQDPQSER